MDRNLDIRQRSTRCPSYLFARDNEYRICVYVFHPILVEGVLVGSWKKVSES